MNACFKSDEQQQTGSCEVLLPVLGCRDRNYPDQHFDKETDCERKKLAPLLSNCISPGASEGPLVWADNLKEAWSEKEITAERKENPNHGDDHNCGDLMDIFRKCDTLCDLAS